MSMKRLLLLLLLFHALQAACPAGGRAETSGSDDNFGGNILFDIGLHDREAYLLLRHSICNRQKIKGASYGTNDRDAGFHDYVISFLIKDNDGKVIFNRNFAGSFKNDHSDVVKTPSGRPPILTRKQILERLPKEPRKIPPSDMVYDIVLDIGAYDRDAYLQIMRKICHGNEPRGALYHVTDRRAGITDYAAVFLFRDKDGKPTVPRYFAGSFRHDHSDVVKTPSGRPPLREYIFYKDNITIFP